MKKSLYFDILKLGLENPNGITFNEIINKLNIDFTDEVAEVNITKWFYMNFYNKYAENRVLAETFHLSTDRIKISNLEIIRTYNSDKSYIKGDALNLYVEYLQIAEARKSSKNAMIISIASLIITAITLFASIFLSK